MRVWVYDSFLQQHNAQVNNLLYTITFYSIFSPSESDGWCPFLSRNTWSRTAARYSHQIFDFSGTFARPRVTCTFLTVYQLSYTLDILLCLDSSRSSTTDIPFSRVGFVSPAQIFHRADSSLRVWENFSTKYVLHLILFWRRSSVEQFSSHVNDMFNVYQQTLRHDDVIV